MAAAVAGFTRLLVTLLIPIAALVIYRVLIKRHDGDSQRRSVVSLTFCLGGHQREVEFSLIDRSEFEYPVLLGRSALAGIAVVDPEAVNLSEPSCNGG